MDYSGKLAFSPADILLPVTEEMEKWSVIACDQFTSDRAYWARVDEYVGENPSTLRLMLPEALLGERDEAAEAEKINAVMEKYLSGGVFRKLTHSYVYLERHITGQRVRRGLLGVIDLDAYDYRPEILSPVNPTEGIVRDRLPSRVKIRAGAALEMPHIMVFIDDPQFTVIEPVIYELHDPDRLYSFDLMEGGGHITGWAVSGEHEKKVEAALLKLAEGRGRSPLYAVGDGNHSLAAAKLHWEHIREGLSESERETHPARWCLAELVNLHDSAIIFEPIHRTVFETETAGLEQAVSDWVSRISRPGSGHGLTLVCSSAAREYTVTGLTLGELIAAVDRFTEEWTSAHGGYIDYVHGDGEAAELGRSAGCFSLLLPPMNKAELFPGLTKSGPFPKKSFSVGHARDKRYYLECRRITPEAGMN